MNANKILIFIVFLFINACMNAQEVVKLWDIVAPTNNGITDAEKIEGNNDWISNVTSAELHIYKPEISNGMAVVICPGGGYAGLAFNHEGIQVAQWLNEQDITGVILKYRMPNKHKEVPLDDAQQAIKYVREHAKELNIYPDKIGIAGFSAGGHLAATASTHYLTGDVNTRPDFTILFYPVITMEVATHGGSRSNLLGDNYSSWDVDWFSAEKNVNSSTPPAILLLSDDDELVQPANSMAYYEALKNNDIPAAMYIFPKGGHGWGMKSDFKYHTQMLSLLQMWLQDINTNNK